MAFGFNSKPVVSVERRIQGFKQKTLEQISVDNDQFLSFLLSLKASDYPALDRPNAEGFLDTINISDKSQSDVSIFAVESEVVESRKSFDEKDEPLVESLNIENISSNSVERENILDKRKRRK